MNFRVLRQSAVATALVCVAAAGCTDTTVQPKSTVTAANIFNDPSSYQSFLARLYAGLAVSGQQGPAGQGDIQGIDEGFSQYMRLYWECEELPTDEAVIAWNDIGLPELNTMTWNPSSKMANAMYYRVYFQVVLANEFLRQTTDAALASRNVSPTLKATIHTYRAEARFLRALSYWHGLDLFGGNIPLVTEADGVGGAPPSPAAPGAIYAYIESELKAIQPDLPAPGASTYGRATTMADHMLLSELYLNAQTYTGTAHFDLALTEAASVIAGPYSLDPSYQHLFQADNNTSPEMIFAVTQDGQHTQTYGGVNFLVHAECGNHMDNNAYGVDGCWWGLRLKPEAFAFYKAGDHRSNGFVDTTGGPNQAQSSIAISNIQDFTQGVAAPKYSNKTSGGATGSNPGFVDTDFPMFRLGEAYLIYAEAAARTGTNLATALGYFNAIRTRAYGNTSANIASAANMTADTVLAERGRELLWEGHRRTDLVRFGKFSGGSYIWSWKGGAQAGIATAARYDLYPLPASELIANPNLKQNPGY
jgi:hypothetical protein